MIELMKNTNARKRRGPVPKLTPTVLRSVNRGLPPKRCGRLEYLTERASELGVTIDAIYKANQRGGYANY